jgi:16S rRNA A1518/A1519 N6-dimethyltransferase RsmA/KsgA/DIM1 with predicted DNA glycosylase/AP lyase activity
VPGRRYRRSLPASAAQRRQQRGQRRGAAQWPPSHPVGAHFLVDQGLIRELVRASGVSTGDLVFDLGAGYGALTWPLAQTGARVIAVELDPALVGRLERRFGAEPAVGVVAADLRWVPFPSRPFQVVANPPFALTTLLCRRLLGDPSIRLAGAELVLELGAARGLTAARPASGELARWAARYQIDLIRRIPATSFSPPPASDAAQVRIRPKYHVSGYSPRGRR